MGELRWILLLIGLAFLALLAAWEKRRSRRSRRELSEPAASAPRHGEPELGHLPEEFTARARPAADAPGMSRLSSARPPVVELPPLGPADADVADIVEPEAPADAPDATADVAAEFAADATPDAMPDATAEVAAEVAVAQEPGQEQALPAESAELAAPAEWPQPSELAGPAQPPESAPLTVEWPPEGERQIIALRILAVSEQRLSGRTARQALAANGFVHGRYGIFHQPGADGRALLSCANLSKPGIFDLASMDFQRFAGLSLFMVLPGPLPAEVALERLLETGRELAQRLQAQLQDEQGHTLDEWRVEQLRNSVREHSTGTSGAQPAEPAA
ncbi:MAG: cell division protein ZipA C-terminal FtsZ-binding domain-containing protein [Steroidobacteraceae bacterium]